MKLNKSISELVHTDFVPVEETKEGLLRGGFGEIFAENDSTRVLNNCECDGNNCMCNDGKDNCSCPNKCGNPENNCKCGTTTTSQPKEGIIFSF